MALSRNDAVNCRAQACCALVSALSNRAQQDCAPTAHLSVSTTPGEFAFDCIVPAKPDRRSPTRSDSRKERSRVERLDPKPLVCGVFEFQSSRASVQRLEVKPLHLELQR